MDPSNHNDSPSTLQQSSLFPNHFLKDLSKDLTHFEFGERKKMLEDFNKAIVDHEDEATVGFDTVEYHRREIESQRVEVFEQLAAKYQPLLEDAGLELTLVRFNSNNVSEFEDLRLKIGIADTPKFRVFLERASYTQLGDHDLEVLRMLQEHLIDTLYYSADLTSAEDTHLLNLLSHFKDITGRLTKLVDPFYQGTPGEYTPGRACDRLASLLGSKILREVLELERSGIINRELVWGDRIDPENSQNGTRSEPPAARWLENIGAEHISDPCEEFKRRWDRAYQAYAALFTREITPLLRLFSATSALRAIERSRNSLAVGDCDDFLSVDERNELTRFLDEQSAKFLQSIEPTSYEEGA